MTETDKMELLSINYLEVIANHSGYFNQNGKDYGTDLSIRKASYSSEKNRIFTTGKAVDIQVKSVSEKNVEDFGNDSSTSIKYDLEVKNYNDLVRRSQRTGTLIPLMLAVFILPNDLQKWLSVNPEELIVRKCAFWYEIEETASLSKNQYTQRIVIPKENRITEKFYDKIFDSLN